MVKSRQANHRAPANRIGTLKLAVARLGTYTAPINMALLSTLVLDVLHKRFFWFTDYTVFLAIGITIMLAIAATIAWADLTYVLEEENKAIMKRHPLNALLTNPDEPKHEHYPIRGH